WSDGLRQWRARVASLRAWMPALGLPDLGDEALLATLDDWLRPAFAGKARLGALGADELAAALRARLDWTQQQALDAMAPVRITVPSGQARAIEYALGDDGEPRPPVLAVKLQELFGLGDTPRIADGRVPRLPHPLSPAGRPLQVTSDLRIFWDRTWPEVAREIKGRYPKHPWPEDPWNAVPTHRARPGSCRRRRIKPARRRATQTARLALPPADAPRRPVPEEPPCASTSSATHSPTRPWTSPAASATGCATPCPTAWCAMAPASGCRPAWPWAPRAPACAPRAPSPAATPWP